MKQSLHIFLKDTRRFYPEILLSLVILVTFVRLYPENWGAHVLSDRLPSWTVGVIVALVPVSWWLVISRVIHAESLVGDRQFWITRPYRWPSLLGAKALFILAYVYVPFLVATMLLLKEGGFHPTMYWRGLLFNLVLATFIAVIPLMVVSTITSNFGKMTLALLIIIAFTAGTAYLSDFLPTASSSTDAGEWIWTSLVECAFIGIIVLQYARRRTALSRLFVVAMALLLATFALAGPEDLLMKATYPDRGSAGSSLRLDFRPEKAESSRIFESGDREVELIFPVGISGVQLGTAVQANDAKITISAQNGQRWTSHWQANVQTWLPGQTDGDLILKVSRPFFDKVKNLPVTIDFTVGVTTLKAGSVTRIKLPDDSFTIPGGAICDRESGYGSVTCRTALRQPPLMLVGTRFASQPCSKDHVLVADGGEGIGWVGNTSTDLAEFGITSVWSTALSFELLPSSDSRTEKGHYFCPGAILAFAPYRVVDRRRQTFTANLTSLANAVRNQNM